MKLFFLFLFLNISSISFEGANPSNYKSQHSTQVYIFMSDECSICRYYMPSVNKLVDQYAEEGVEFIGVFPNFSSKKDKIEAYKNEFDIKFDLKTDYYKKLCKRFNIKVVPEVVVLSEDRVIYQGRIDNSYYGIGKRRRVITTNELEQVLESLKMNQEVKIQNQEAIGCFINYGELDQKK